jgi:hypothetical protein
MTTTTQPDTDILGEPLWAAPIPLSRDRGREAIDLFGPLSGGAYGKVARIIHTPKRPGERERWVVWNLMGDIAVGPHFCRDEAKAREIAEGFLP